MNEEETGNKVKLVLYSIHDLENVAEDLCNSSQGTSLEHIYRTLWRNLRHTSVAFEDDMSRVEYWSK